MKKIEFQMLTAFQPEPTVRPASGFNASDDGIALRAAMKGFGTDEQAIIDILTQRSNDQRQQIASFFTREYGRVNIILVTRLFGNDIIDDLKSELGGKFEDVIIALMLPPADYLAKQLHKSMEGMGTDEHTMVEILCTKSNNEIQQLVDAYERLLIGQCLRLTLSFPIRSNTNAKPKALIGQESSPKPPPPLKDCTCKKTVYDRPLAEHMCSETSGDFRRLLTLIVTSRSSAAQQAGSTAALQGVRNDASLDPAKAKDLAEQLYAAGELKVGTDEEVFNRILAHESFPQLRLIFEEYKNVTGRSIEQALESEISGELLEAMLAIVECVQSPPNYFAKRLHWAVAGAGTNDGTLIRIIVSRSEIDLGNIKREYERLYDKTLESAVKDETSGDYKHTLVALIGGP
uniref:Annexin n=1 Tax=Timema shepardi TaxID=629360 RepID=A0A7R9AVY3_TIMSH|nr:unnamed protein product [Timema shepardi]